MKNLLLIIILSISLVSCNKEDAQDATSSTENRIVTIYAYSEQGLSVINYMDAEGINYITPIYDNEFIIETNQSDESFKYSISLTSKGPDSLFLSAKYGDKTTSSAFRSNGFGETEISINLNNLN